MLLCQRTHDAPRIFQYFVPRTLQILAALGPNDWPSDSEEETSQRSAFRSYSDANSKNLAVSWPLYVSWPLAEPTKPSKPKSAKAKQKKLREVEQEDLGEVEKPRPKKPRLQSLKASLVATIAQAEHVLRVVQML